MSDIECPHCHQKFEMDAAGYASIVNQVRSAEFEAEVASRIADAEKAHAIAIQLAEAKIIEQKDSEFANKDKQIERLKGDLQKKEMEIKIAVSHTAV